MQSSLIVLIVLRLFSLYWLVQVLTELATAATEFSIKYAGGETNTAFYLTFFPALLLLVLAVATWITAPKLARRILGEYDTVLEISGLTRQDLYCFAIVFLGLYFALASVGDVINWLHYYFINAAQTSLSYSQRQPPNYYGMSQSLITLIAGLTCFFKGKSWAGKLISAGK